MGPAGFLDKALAGRGSLLAGVTCSLTEGHALGVQRREREEDYKQTKTQRTLSELNKCVY